MKGESTENGVINTETKEKANCRHQVVVLTYRRKQFH